ncbi:MAG: MnhB domain-containing protein, partial [Burkholderiaceae bacterium]
VFHIMNHATFKASLFMAAGIVDHEAGTRDLRKLGGLRQSMPITATLATVASAAMAGVPLLNGFLSKEMFFAETIYLGGEGAWMSRALPVLATVAGTFSVAYSLRFVYATFFGAPRDDLPRAPHEPPRWMRFPVEALVFLCLIVGIVPQETVGPLLAVGAAAMLQATPPEYSLAIWHGFNLPLMMSVVALVAGVLLYKTLLLWLGRRTVTAVPITSWFDGRRTYRAVLIGLMLGARAIGRLVSTRRLQKQLLLIVVVAFAAGATPLWLGQGISRGPVPSKEINPVFVVFWAVGMACAVGAAWQAKYHRLAALIMLGGAGLVTCLTYVWFSAPDLALTQVMVEIVTTVLMLLGLRWLPKRFEPRGAAGRRRSWRARGRRLRDLIVSIVGGAGVGALAFAVLTRPVPESVANHYLARSLSEGGGANTVNVIIVDFRGFDTMGEIVVLGVVALTVFALLRRFRPPPESLETPHQRRARAIDEIVDAEEAAEAAARERAEAERRAAAAAAAQAMAADAVRAAIETQEAHAIALAQGLVEETALADGLPERPADEEAADRFRRKRIERHAIDSATGDFVLPAIVLRLMMPLAGLVSVYLFLRGHNDPGGGFVAGLVFAVAIIMQYMVSGTDWVEAHMSLRPVRWIAVGLLLAAGTGASAVVFGHPWLTSQDTHLHLPLIGDLHLSTVMLFDLGVFALVVGAVILILIALAHQSRRRHRAIAASGRQRATAGEP